MKGLFVLAALAAAAIWLSMPSGAGAERLATESPVPNMTNEASHNLQYKIEGVGHTLTPGGEGGFGFECTASEDGDAVCSATDNLRTPPVAYRLFWCEDEDNCIYFEYVPGDQWCSYLREREGMSRSEVAASGCVWGIGHRYTLVVTINAVGGIDAEYTSEPIFNPDTGKQYPRRPGRVYNKECLRALREMARTGEYGPVPECAGSRYRYDQDTGTVPVE